jgi:hypothetical protein
VSKEKKLLDHALGIDGFLESILFMDKLDDWTAAVELGRYLVQVDSMSLCAHLILAIACRHLGDERHVSQELQACRTIVERGDLGAEVILIPVLEQEERRVRGMGEAGP